jgi:hypothetical protein
MLEKLILPCSTLSLSLSLSLSLTSLTQQKSVKILIGPSPVLVFCLLSVVRGLLSLLSGLFGDGVRLSSPGGDVGLRERGGWAASWAPVKYTVSTRTMRDGDGMIAGMRCEWMKKSSALRFCGWLEM